MEQLDASVVIPTRNRAASLERCLISLEADESAANAEIIVVDNGSSDETGVLLREMRLGSRRPLMVVSEPTAGSSAARNAGARAATGRYVLFTDDDVVVRTGWIDALVGAFDDSVGAIGGRVIPRLSGPPPGWFDIDRNPLTLWDEGDQPFEMTVERHPFTANMAICARLLTRLGEPFDRRLGHLGRLRLAYEDVHFAATLLRDGRIRYEPDAVVEHCVEAQRLTFDFVRRAWFHYGFGRARYERLSGKQLPPMPQRLGAAVRSYRYAFYLRARDRGKGPSSTAAARHELMAFATAGRHLETLLGGVPSLANWFATTLV